MVQAYWRSPVWARIGFDRLPRDCVRDLPHKVHSMMSLPPAPPRFFLLDAV